MYKVKHYTKQYKNTEYTKQEKKHKLRKGAFCWFALYNHTHVT